MKSTNANGDYLVHISGLKANFTYYYRAYAVDAGQYKYGDVCSFKTSVSIITGDASNITYSKATLSGMLNSSDESVTCGIIYGTSSNLSSSNGTLKSTKSSGPFTVDVTGLLPNTTYFYRAYVVIDGEYKYGVVRSFTTTQEITVSTGDASVITENNATLGGTVSGSSKSVTCGIIYGTSGLSSSHGIQKSTSSSGSFTIDVTGLSPNTTYYYYAYVYVDGEYKYGDMRSFTTKQNVAVTTGDAIDLGLSVKWASCNIGATSPEEYGDYYAWGETTAKSSYSVDDESVTYDFSTSELQSRGIIGADGNLTAAYDAATANWGGNWRMPTSAEIKELIDNCSWSWTTRNGVNGYKVTGPNGNFIFLPTAGYRGGTEVYGRGSYGYYWSGTLYEGNSYDAYGLSFYSGDHDWLYYYRYVGHPVRPITEK